MALPGEFLWKFINRMVHSKMLSIPATKNTLPEKWLIVIISVRRIKASVIIR